MDRAKLRMIGTTYSREPVFQVKGQRYLFLGSVRYDVLCWRGDCLSMFHTQLFWHIQVKNWRDVDLPIHMYLPRRQGRSTTVLMKLRLRGSFGTSTIQMGHSDGFVGRCTIPQLKTQSGCLLSKSCLDPAGQAWRRHLVDLPVLT